MKTIIALLAVIALCAAASTVATFVRRVDVDLIATLAFELAQERAAHRATIAKANEQITKSNAEIENGNVENKRLADLIVECRSAKESP